MRTLVISDIHANLPALNAVLEDAGSFSSTWCLGDLVGYGPDPNECVERVRSLPGLVCIKGNHDAAILGEIDTQMFNPEARRSLAWLRSSLNELNRDWLAELDTYAVVGEVTLVHGSPRNPIWEYILNREIARENIGYFDTQICLVGHTHVSCLYAMENEDPFSTTLKQMENEVPFQVPQKCILNPGSVGQPRDRDPRAAYMIYDDEEEAWTYHRVAYDNSETQARILAAGLPHVHANRLRMGL